jgi:hypothetical protein
MNGRHCRYCQFLSQANERFEMNSAANFNRKTDLLSVDFRTNLT